MTTAVIQHLVSKGTSTNQTKWGLKNRGPLLVILTDMFRQIGNYILETTKLVLPQKLGLRGHP